MRLIALISGVLVNAVLAAAPSTQPTSQPEKSARTGRFELQFATPHELASQREAQKRFRWEQEPQPFKLADETFQILVPDTYQPDGSYGLFVWISPMPRGGVPKIWVDSLAKHKLIWIGPDHSENERHIDHRCRLGVEAALHMQDLYVLDSKRIYIGGFSGGGKIAAITAANYADIFAGAYSICGPIFYRNIPVGTEPNKFYPQGYFGLPPKMMKKFKEESRHVLLTGDADFNLQPTRQIYEQGYLKEKFKHVEYIVVPDLAHDLPPADWFEKGLVFLDRHDATTRPH